MFEHSIKVPQLYKTTAKFVKIVEENDVSLESLVYKQKHLNIKAAYALVVNSFKYSKQLEFLLKKSRILEKEPRLDPWLAKVLITELVWGKKRLSGESKPVKTVLAYQQIFNAHSSDIAEPSQEVKIVSVPRYVRVNTLLISVNEAVESFRDEGWRLVRFMNTKNYSGFLEKVANLGAEEFMVDIHVKELLIFPPNTQFYNHSAYKDGLILLQDKASCLPIHLLDPKPETTVLDMCAAPGMKTSQIACKLENKGKIYAVDLNLERLKEVDILMEKCGVTCVKTIHSDVLNVKDKECPNVEYILVDPSCSGSGMVNRVELRKKDKDDEGRIEKLFGFQVMILKHAFRHFPNVKRVVYSTCSLNSKENERVIQEVITNCSAFKLVDARKLMPSWYNFGSEEFREIGKRCLYSRPEQDYTIGFFVAIFEKLEDGEVNEFLITNKAKQNVKAVNKLIGGNQKINKEGLQKRPKTKKNMFQETKIEEGEIDCNVNDKQEQEINEEMLNGMQNDDKKKSEKKLRRKEKDDAVKVYKFEDNENVECQEQDNKLNKKSHKKKKRSIDQSENLRQRESIEIQKEVEENCDIPQSVKKRRKSSLVEEKHSGDKSINKGEHLIFSDWQLPNKENEKQLTNSLKKKKKHNAENYLNCVDVMNSENTEEKQSVFENSLDLQSIKRKKRQKLLNEDKSLGLLNNQYTLTEIQEDSSSLIIETQNDPQGTKKKKTKGQFLGNEEGAKLVIEESARKKKKCKAEMNTDYASEIDNKNTKQQLEIYENNPSPKTKGKEKWRKSTEIGEEGDDLQKEKKDKKKHRSFLGTEILIKEEISHKETEEDDPTRHFSKLKQNRKIEKKLDVSEISSNDFESPSEKKKRQKRLNEENSVIRESLSDFLQTLSSPV